MRISRHTLLALATVALAIGLGTNAYAFHSGGVAECSGCHSMHSPYPGGSSLLIGSDKSATCLSCHQQAGLVTPSSYHISTADADMPVGTAPLQRTPGGDFGWLKKTYTWAGRGTPPPTETETGASHGHNIIAGASETGTYNYVIDPDNAAAPGGTYPSANLGCTSCHDPHGKARRLADGTVVSSGLPIVGSGSYTNSTLPVAGTKAVGAYRILAGPGYQTDGVTFDGVPAAIAPSTYNVTEALNQVKVAYGRSTAAGNVPWSQWCGECHGDMHYDNGSKYVHPTDNALGTTIFDNYNAYKKSGDLTGVQASSFSSLTPFFYNIADYEALKTKTGAAAPTFAGPDSGSDRVDCLSCHRAHASGWEFALRWNPEYEMLTDANGAYFNGSFGGRGHSTAEVQAAYYDRPATVFSVSQRSLCNKCHVKD